jgi:hypothetical protein
VKVRGVINVVGIPTRVVATSAEEVADSSVLGPTDYSSYDADTSTITLADSITEPAMQDFYITHETLHAGLAHAGLMVKLQARFRLTDEETSALEEDIVTALTPAVHSSHTVKLNKRRKR